MSETLHANRIIKEFKQELSSIEKEEHHDDITFINTHLVYWNHIVQAINSWYTSIENRHAPAKDKKRARSSLKRRLLYEGHNTIRIIESKKTHNPQAKHKQEMVLEALNDRIKYIESVY